MRLSLERRERDGADAAGGEDTGDDSGSEVDTATTGRWSGLRLLWVHAAFLAVVLVVAVMVVDNGSISIVDEGVYATQAGALADGSWWSPRPAVDADPDGMAVPLGDSTVKGDQVLAYGRHPLYPLVLTPFYAVGGYSAALLTSAAGVLVAALVAAFLARRISPRYGPPALWIAGLGCPLAVDSVVLWAHALAAACAGLVYLGVVRALDGRRVGLHLTYAAVAAVATVMLRSEGVLFVGAVAAVVGLEALPAWWRRDRGQAAFSAAIAVGLVALGAGSYLLDARISKAIGGSGGYGAQVSTLVLGDRTGPANAAWVSLLRPWIGGFAFANPLYLSGLVFLLAALLAHRLLPRLTAVPFVLVLFAAVAMLSSLVRGGVDGMNLVTGLFAAFPALSAAILLVGPSDFRVPEFRRAAAVFVVGLAAIVLTIYGEGGVTEWGGRFFHILLVPVIGPMIWLIDQRRRVFQPIERRVLFVGVALVLVAPSVIGLRAIATGKRQVTVDVATLASVSDRLATSGQRPLAAYWRLGADGSSRFFWSLSDQIDVLQLSRFRSVNAFLAQPAVRRRGELVVVTDVVGAAVLAKTLDRRLGWTIEDTEVSDTKRMVFVVLRQ